MLDAKNINLNLYRTFIAVAESNSFAEAAGKLYTTDKAISNDINLLEKQLGVQLFYRKHKGSNNGLKITDIGREIYPQVKKLISASDFIPTMIESGNSLEHGKLSIGCPSHISDFFLMEKLIKLVKDYPDVEIILDTESSSEKMITELKGNEIDFIILDTIPEDYKNELEIEKIKDIENIFVSKEKITINKIEEMQKYKYILSYEDRSTTKKLKEALKNYNINMDITLRCPTTEQRVKATKEGMGITYVMKEAVKRELENEELYQVKLPIKLPMNGISVVYYKNQLTKVDKEFIKRYIKV